jgi:hypothetical protein
LAENLLGKKFDVKSELDQLGSPVEAISKLVKRIVDS